MSEILWYALSIEETLKQLKTSKKGISEKEVKSRIQRFGRNTLPKKARLTSLAIFLDQLKSPLVYILLLAAFVSFVLREFVDAVVIFLAVAINSTVGFVQEYKSENALERLQTIVTYKAHVLRNGEEVVIDSTKLVSGDILLLEAGDRVPADGRIIALTDFHVNEASLTGESLPIKKSEGVLQKGVSVGDRMNMVFMGTTVTRGKATVVICETGIRTQLGQIASLVKEVREDPTPLQTKMASLSKKIGLAIVFLSLFIFGFGLLRGHELFEMFEMAVAIAVSAIPEGLIVGVTIILTVGMQRILRQKALVKKLVAAETLGSTSVICTDKTGTLTEGRMQVTELLTGCCDLQKDLISIGTKKEPVKTRDHVMALTIATLCNDSIVRGSLKSENIGNPTEIALKSAAKQLGINEERLLSKQKRIAEIPFSGERKFMATLHKSDKENIVYTKGAPEKILSFSTSVLIDGKEKPLTDALRKEIAGNIEGLSKKGLRVLAVGYKKVGAKFTDLEDDEKLNDIVFVGLFGMKDPLRKETKETIAMTESAGIRTVIITGDHRLTVKAIAEEMGMHADDSEIADGKDLDRLSDAELKKVVKKIKIYARVSPKHKLRIIKAWKSHGESVAMLGDGVNDAPALKVADIGVGLGSGTDVAKETADIILLDNNFKTIVSAVKEGRVVFDNIRKIITYLLSDSFTEVVLVGGALLLGMPLPISALQILFINIINDGPPNIALSFEPEEKDVMNQPPRKKKEPIINNEMKVLIFIIGIITALILFGIFLYLKDIGYDIVHIRTVIFIALGIDSLLYVFSIKSLRRPIWKINIFSNMYLVGAVALGFIFLLLALYVPIISDALELTHLSSFDWMVLLGLGAVNVIMIELGKWFFIHKRSKLS